MVFTISGEAAFTELRVDRRRLRELLLLEERLGLEQADLGAFHGVGSALEKIVGLLDEFGVVELIEGEQTMEASWRRGWGVWKLLEESLVESPRGFGIAQLALRIPGEQEDFRARFVRASGRHLLGHLTDFLVGAEPDN